MLFKNDPELIRLVDAQGYTAYEIIKNHSVDTKNMQDLLLKSMITVKSKNLEYWTSAFQIKKNFDEFFKIPQEFRKPITKNS